MTESENERTTDCPPILRRLINALTINGLRIDKIEQVPTIGFENPCPGYAIWVGRTLSNFETEYNQILDRIPRGYTIDANMWHDTLYHILPEEKRDILARRVMLKKAIESLETKIEEEHETSEGDNYIIDTYYRIKIDGKAIGLFIKYPNGDIWPAGF